MLPASSRSNAPPVLTSLCVTHQERSPAEWNPHTPLFLTPHILLPPAEFLPKTRQFTDAVRTFAYGTDASFYRLNPKLVLKVGGGTGNGGAASWCGCLVYGCGWLWLVWVWRLATLTLFRCAAPHPCPPALLLPRCHPPYPPHR